MMKTARRGVVVMGGSAMAVAIGLWLMAASSVGVQAQNLPGQPIHCVVTISTATTITAVGGDCVAPPQNRSIYITSILFAANAGAIAADTFNTLKYGTGGTCGTGTTVFWGAMAVAAEQHTTVETFPTPIRLPAQNEICWINSTAGSKFLVITGYIAP